MKFFMKQIAMLMLMLFLQQVVLNKLYVKNNYDRPDFPSRRS